MRIKQQAKQNKATNRAPMAAEPSNDAAKDAAKKLDFGSVNKNIGYTLRRAQIALFQNFYAHLSQFDIRPAQYTLLTLVERNAGLSQSQLADALGIKKTNFVAMINALEARHLLRREVAPHDKRFHALYLTEQGLALMPQLRAAVGTHEGEISVNLSEEERQILFSLLKKIIAA